MKAWTRRVNGRTYLTTAGAARWLGVSEAFVLRVADRGPGPDGVGLCPEFVNVSWLLFRREAVRRFAEGEPMPGWKEYRRTMQGSAFVRDARIRKRWEESGKGRNRRARFVVGRKEAAREEREEREARERRGREAAQEGRGGGGGLWKWYWGGRR